MLWFCHFGIYRQMCMTKLIGLWARIMSRRPLVFLVRPSRCTSFVELIAISIVGSSNPVVFLYKLLYFLYLSCKTAVKIQCQQIAVLQYRSSSQCERPPQLTTHCKISTMKAQYEAWMEHLLKVPCIHNPTAQREREREIFTSFG